jgi:glycosyltransferase involved in cell wall biosynthesis
LENTSSYPLVSVIIPVYNGAKYLRDSIDSVISQTYELIEVIVVDDGSQDSTREIIESYQSQVKGLHKLNGGVASALNLGILHARGEYIAWLSHDDLYCSQKIEKQVLFMEQHPQVGVCYTDFEIVDANRRHVSIIHVPWRPRQEMAHYFLRNMYINGSTTMIRKCCFEKIGLFNEQLMRTQDIEMWLRIAQFYEFGHLPLVLIQSRSHPEQGTWAFENQLEEERSTFTYLFQSLGSITFFPALEKVKEPKKQMALGLQMFGDELMVHRHWYWFAMNQYQSALLVWPMFQTRIKLFQSRLSIFLFGDESDSLFLVKRARFINSQGDQKQARALAAVMLRKHPLRLDALAIWISTLIPSRIFQFAKTIKRSIMVF